MGRIKAALNGRERYRGKAYFFKGTNYLRYDWGQDRTDYGLASLSAWNLPAPFDEGFDAALNGEGFYNGRGFLFRGKEYLRYDWRLEGPDGGPRSLDIWGMPDPFGEGVDAALSGDLQYATQAFIFKGTQYVTLDWTQDVITGPFQLSDWNLPGAFASGFDTALNGQGRYAGKAYFFKGEEYVRYDWLTNQVDVLPTPIVPNWPGLDLLPTAFDRSQIVVKLQDALPIPYVDGVESLLAPMLGGAWESLVTAFPFLTMRRMYETLTPAELQALMNELALLTGEAQPNLLRYYLIDAPPADAPSIAAMLTAMPVVEATRIQSPPQLASVHPYDDPLFAQQSHLRPPPDGVNAEYAWDFPGADGAGVRYLQIEYGFELNHPDLPPKPQMTYESGVNSADVKLVNHATGGLGVVVAADNAIGCIGIAPSVSASVISTFRTANSSYNLHDALAAAAKLVSPSEPWVVLMMLSHQDLPLDVDVDYVRGIKMLTDKGATVVLSAGNHVKPVPAPAQNTTAILVGMVRIRNQQGLYMKRATLSNFGARVHCFAPSEGYWTIAVGTLSGYQSFSGTSGAGAIVAGAASALLGMYKAKNNAQLSAADVRAKLSDTSINTHSADPVNDAVGVMPDLRQIAHSIGLWRPIRAWLARLDADMLHLAYVDDESQFAFRSWDASASSTWTGAGAKPGAWLAARRPALICRTTKVADAFMISPTGQLHTATWTLPFGHWTDPASIGGGPVLAGTAAPAAVARVATHIDVFAVGNNGVMQTTWWDASSAQQGWSNLAAVGSRKFSVDGGLAAVVTKDAVMLVFGVRTDGFLACGAYPDAPGGSKWHDKFDPIGTVKLALRCGVAAVATPGVVFAFAIGLDGTLRMTHAATNPTPASMSWIDPVSISGTVSIARDGTVAAVARNTKNVDVFVIGADKQLYHTSWDDTKPPGQWNPLQQIGGATSLATRGGVTAAARNENDVHVVACNETGKLLTTRWQPASGWSTLTLLP